MISYFKSSVIPISNQCPHSISLLWDLHRNSTYRGCYYNTSKADAIEFNLWKSACPGLRLRFQPVGLTGQRVGPTAPLPARRARRDVDMQLHSILMNARLSITAFLYASLPWRDGIWICNCYAAHECPTFHYRIFVCQVLARGLGRALYLGYYDKLINWIKIMSILLILSSVF